MNPYGDIEKTKKSKSTSSKDALKAAFIDLLNRKSYDLITVKMLCNQAHVARTTFYANYANVDEMLEEIEDDIIVDLLEVNQHNKKEAPGALLNVADNMTAFLNEYRVILRVLLVKEVDVRFLKKFKTAIKYHFYDIVCSMNGGKENGMIMEMLAGMAVGAYSYQVEHDEKNSGKQVLKTITEALKILEYE